MARYIMHVYIITTFYDMHKSPVMKLNYKWPGKKERPFFPTMHEIRIRSWSPLI